MKNITTLFLTWILLICLGACTKSDFEYQNDFEQSYQVWQDFKRSSNNSYYYVVSRSTWTGSTWETTITVDQGIITRRDFHYIAFNGFLIPNNGWTIQEAKEIATALNRPEMPNHLEPEELLNTLSWTEGKSEIGSHELSSAASPLTLDEIYDLAKNEWLLKRSDASASFESKNNGMISHAGFVPDGCMDDCFFGISIKVIKAL